MRRVLLVCAIAACGEDAVPPTGEITAAVTHYEYRFDVVSRAAHATVTATVEAPGDCLALPFRAQDFDVTTARIDGAPVTSGAVDASTLRLCGAGHEAGASLTLDVDMTIPLATVGQSQVGYSVTTDSAGNPFYYLVSWIGGCDQFGPCDSRPDRFATYTFHVTHPADLRVACSGTITQGSATETTCAFDHVGGPTYSTFGVGAYPAAAWIPTDKGTWGSARVTVHDRAATGIAAAIEPAHHAGFVAWMEATFGPYPYGDELRIVTAPTYWSGFEHPGNIVLDDGLAQVLRPAYRHNVQHVLDHELAHQWAGDQTTLADTYDFVWKEAMAEYLTFVYEDQVERAAALTTAAAWKSFASGARYFPVPAERPRLFDYYGDVYGAGPMILFRQVEVRSSRAQVIAALQTLLGQPRAISVDDVIAALETTTGLDLDAYAAAWIHGSGAPAWPRIATSFAEGAGTSTLRVQQTAAPERRCAFHVRLLGAGAGEQVDVPVDTVTGGLDQTLRLPTPAFEVTSIALDPLRECLVYPGTLARTERVHPWRSARGRAADEQYSR